MGLGLGSGFGSTFGAGIGFGSGLGSVFGDGIGFGSGLVSDLGAGIGRGFFSGVVSGLGSGFAPGLRGTRGSVFSLVPDFGLSDGSSFVASGFVLDPAGRGLRPGVRAVVPGFRVFGSTFSSNFGTSGDLGGASTFAFASAC
jgi:hypothetical protein